MARGKKAGARNNDLEELDATASTASAAAAPATKKMGKKGKAGKKQLQAIADSDDDDKFDLKLQEEGGDEDEDEEEEEPETKRNGQKHVNAFDFLQDEDDAEEDDAEGDESVSKQMDELELEGTKKSKKKSSTSGKNGGEEKKDRKTRKKEKAQRMAEAAAGKSNEEAEKRRKTPVSAGAGLANSRLFFSYASGQPLGPDGTNPADAIAVTGNLLSPPNSRDVQVEKVSVSAFGKTLIKDSELNLINGRRYGLIAPNGSGKSTLLHALACGIMPVPQSLDYYLLDREFRPSELTSIEAVLDINEQERKHLEEEMDELLADPDENAVRLDFIQSRLTELDADSSEHKVRKILKGLQFTDDMLSTKTKDLSGGWRMRISLARILFVKPTLMMLDEPTNHLDLEAVAWLEEYLTHELAGHTLLITCHTQDTLNEVCTDIIHLHHHRLDYYPGNYDTFVKVRAEKDIMLSKKAKQKDKDMAKLQNKLNMTGSDQQKQAKAKVKAMEKRAEKEKKDNKVLEEELINEKELHIVFEDCGGGIPSPALKFQDVTFGYPGRNILFKDLNFGIDLKSRVALVGPNGCGKTTLINLLLGKLEPLSGHVSRHHSLRMALFHQHMSDQLDMNKSAVDWLRTQFGDRPEGEMRRMVGRYGLTGKSQVIPMRQLSDGQRRRVLFCYLGMRQPHILLMDEPTNALDISTIDALAEAINNFDGGVIIISHDLRLIEQTAEEIWLVGNNTVRPLEGDIRDYKDMLKARIHEEREEERRQDMLAMADEKQKSQTVLGLH